MFWRRNLAGLALVACLLAMAINLAAGAYVYPMRPHSIDPLLFGAGGGGGGSSSGGGGFNGAGGGGPSLPKKRPFCNAFTGCGRKRSDPDMFVGPADQQQQQQPMPLPAPPSFRPSPTAGRPEDNTQEREPQNPPQANALNGFDDTLVDLLDLNSEPAIEDLMRQIMSQAKMWEAIQEANREMIMQKNDRNAMSDEQSPRVSFPTVAFNSQ